MHVNALQTDVDLLEDTLVKLDAMIAHATHLRVQVVRMLCDVSNADPLDACLPSGAPSFRPLPGDDMHIDLMDAERGVPLGAPVCARSVR